jgi:hypothetical protein
MSVFGASPMRFLEGVARAAKREHTSGRAARGLFAGRDKRFGNNVSFSKRKYVTILPPSWCMAGD